MPEIMIFKSGKYAQGDWSKERVEKMVNAYDPEKNHEAPVVIGHRWVSDTDEDQMAHGWVKSLRMDGSGKVFAEVPEFSGKVKAALAEKMLRYVSAEIYEFDKQDAAVAPYLRAVSLLGRDAPAVQGTRLPAIFEELVNGGTVVSLQEDSPVAAFTRRVSAEETRTIGQTKAQEEAHSMEETEKLKLELAAKEQELAVFQKEREEMKTAVQKKDAEKHYGTLRDEGKLAPALFEQAVALDARLGDENR